MFIPLCIGCNDILVFKFLSLSLILQFFRNYVKQTLLLFVMQDKRKDAVKKVIAAMTVGKDVSSLFTDVVNCMQTENLELKKLVYLYLINYAKSQPDLAILAVNTFVKVRTTIDHLSCIFETLNLLIISIIIDISNTTI